MQFPNWLTVYGNTSYRGECPREDAELGTLFNQLKQTYPDIAKRAFHVENEGKKDHTQSRIKGQLKGVSDIVIIGTPTLIIEMKRRDHTKSHWQSGQIEFLEACHNAGAMVCVALSWEHAMEAVYDWINS